MSKRAFLVACLCLLLASLESNAAQVTLAWDAPTNFAATAYKVYYGYASHSYTYCFNNGTSTVRTITGLDTTSMYYFAVTACEGTNSESVFSSEVVWSANDTDADGMQDAWEALFFNGTQATNGAALQDFDQDGICNLEEYIAGSNPDSPDTYADVDISFSNGQSVVSFVALAAGGTGYAGKTRYYRLEQCSDLAAGVWTPVPGYTSIAASNQLVTCSTASAPTCRTRVWLQ